MSVGLDIGSKTIKAIELKKSGKTFSLKAAGAVGYSIPINISNLKNDKDLKQIALAVKKLINDAKITTRKFSISIPESQSFTRIIKFPLLNDQEVASAVKWEAEEYIPIPIQEAIIEHQILERRETATPPQVLVLLVAVHRELVEKYIKMLEMIGVKVVGVETNLMSLTRALAPTKGTSVLIDIGATAADIAITRNEILYFSRTISTAGDAFTRAVAQSLGVSLDQAEQYKRTYGLSPDQLEGKIQTALTPLLRNFVEDVKKAIHYYQIEIKGDAPTTIILTGGSSGLPGLPIFLTKTLGLEVIIGNPFAKINVEQQTASNIANFAPLYSVATGLAMRGD
jgi:type IV pilus assembly protein PilM